MQKLILITLLAFSGSTFLSGNFELNKPLEVTTFDECTLYGECGDSKRENCSSKKKDICVISLSCKKRGAEYTGKDDEILAEIFK